MNFELTKNTYFIHESSVLSCHLHATRWNLLVFNVDNAAVVAFYEPKTRVFMTYKRIRWRRNADVRRRHREVAQQVSGMALERRRTLRK